MNILNFDETLRETSFTWQRRDRTERRREKIDKTVGEFNRDWRVDLSIPGTDTSTVGGGTDVNMADIAPLLFVLLLLESSAV